MAQSLFMSFTDTKAKDLRTPFSVDIIGVENYTRAFSDETFLQAIRNTAYFVLLGVPLTMTLALAAAVALDRGITKFRSLFRLGFYTPVVTSIVAVAVVWQFLLQDDFGLINTALGWVGIDGPNWLGDANWSMPGADHDGGLAQLRHGHDHLPRGAAGGAVDAARGRRDRRGQRVAALPPRHAAAAASGDPLRLGDDDHRVPAVLRGALRHDQGGPLDSTISMSLYTYKQFGFGNYGYAAALGYIIFVAVAVITALQFRALRENT